MPVLLDLTMPCGELRLILDRGVLMLTCSCGGAAGVINEDERIELNDRLPILVRSMRFAHKLVPPVEPEL